MTKINSTLDKWGIKKETYEKTKDILPIVDFKSLESESQLYGQFLEAEPREIEVKDINNPDEKVKTRVINVYVDKVINGNSDIEIPIGEKQQLMLSSATLRMSILRNMDSAGLESLEGVKFKVLKTQARFKQGLNNVYRVTFL